MSKTLGIEDFAKRAKVEPATARIMLRKIKAKKVGRSYEFENNAQMDKLIAKARGGKKSEAPAKKKEKADA